MSIESLLYGLIAKLIAKLPSCLQGLFKQNRDARIAKAKQAILSGFEKGQAQVKGRFCPSRDEIVQSMSRGIARDAEIVNTALTQLAQEGYIKYDGGRYYLS